MPSDCVRPHRVSKQPGSGSCMLTHSGRREVAPVVRADHRLDKWIVRLS